MSGPQRLHGRRARRTAGRRRRRRRPGASNASQERQRLGRALEHLPVAGDQHRHASGIAATPGSSLPSSSSSEAPPPVEIHEIRSARPSLVDRAHRVAAADDREAVAVGDRLARPRTCPRRSGGHSKTPIGPFQKTVFAPRDRLRELLARLRADVEPEPALGHARRTGTICVSASAANDGRRDDVDRQQHRRTRTGSRRGPPRPSCRRSAPVGAASRGSGARRSCRRPWRRPTTSDERPLDLAEQRAEVLELALEQQAGVRRQQVRDALRRARARGARSRTRR